MAIETSDIYAALKTRWEAVAGVVAVVPGGFHSVIAAKAKVGTSQPYCVCTVEEGEIQTNSGSVIVQTFKVMMAVYSRDGVTDSGTIRKLIATAFSRANKNELSITGVDKVIDIDPIPRTQQLQERKEGQDTLLTSHDFNLMLQGAY